MKIDVENIEKHYLSSGSHHSFLSEKKALQQNGLYSRFAVFPWFHVGLFFKEPSEDLIWWSHYVKRSFDNKCMITNAYCEKDLHAHHLFGKSKFPSGKFLYLNGLPVNARFHRLFHSMYGNNCTPREMRLFVDFLLTCEDKSIDKNNLHLLKSWLGLIHPILLSKIRRFFCYSCFLPHDFNESSYL